MESKFFVQTDRELIEETLTLDGSPVDLTNRSVETIFTHDEDGQIDLENTTEIVGDPTNGQIRHQFTTQDLNRAGNYAMEWYITGGPQDPTTIPKQYPVDVHVRPAGRLVENAADIHGIDANRVEFEGKTIDPQTVNATTLNAVNTTTDDFSTKRITSENDVIEIMKGLDMGGNEIHNVGEPTSNNSAARIVDVNEVKANFNTHSGVADAHHSRYTDAEVESIIDALTSLDIDVSGSASHATTADDAMTLDGNSPDFFLSQDDFDFHEAQSGIHHQRYQDSEAVTAVNNETSLNVDIEGNASTATYAEYADVVGDEQGMYIRDLEFNEHTEDPDAHHTRYTDFDVLEAVNNEEQIDVSITGNAETATFAESAGSLEGSGADEFATSQEFTDHSIDQSAHHVRYSDNEALSAIDDSEIMPAEITQPTYRFLEISARLDQDRVLNNRVGFSPNVADNVSPLGWINNFLYRSYGEERSVTVSPNPSSGTVGNMFRPSGYAEWPVADLPVSIEFDLPENEVFAFFANSPTSDRYASETATLELRVDGTWQEYAVSENGRPYIFDGFYESNATHGRITFSGPSADQQYLRVDSIAGYTEANKTEGLYLSKEGGRMYGDLNLGGNDIVNAGNIDDSGSGGGGIGDLETQTASGDEREFRWDTGTTGMDHVQVTPTSEAASANHRVNYSGSEIIVTYNIEPDQGDTMAWFWLVNGSVDGGDGTGDGGDTGTYVTQNEFDQHVNDTSIHGESGVTHETFDTHVAEFDSHKTTFDNHVTEFNNHVNDDSIHGGGDGGSSGIGNRYPNTGTVTADGSTDTFTWSVDTTEEIEYALVNAATTDASADFSTSIDNSRNEISVTYSTNPEGELAWFWSINVSTESVNMSDGIGDRYPDTGTVTADGSTTTFGWPVGTDEDIRYTSIDAATTDASTDFSTWIDNTNGEIGVTYATEPTGDLAWYWSVNSSPQSINVSTHGDDSHDSTVPSQTEVDTKADQTTVDTLQTEVDGKAEQTTVDTLQTEVDTKADRENDDITPSTISTATEPFVDASHPSYGATGDGTTDDTQSIQAAVSAAQSSDTPLHLPSGTYSITSTIDIGDVHLTGDGMGKTIISIDSTMTEGIVVSGEHGMVSDLTIHCNGSTHKGLNLTAPRTEAIRVESDNPSQYGTTNTTTACISAFSAENGRIHQCVATRARAPNTGVSRGILVDGSNGGEFEVSNCYVDDVTPSSDGDGIVVQSGNPNSRVVNNNVTEAAKSAVKVNAGAENTVVSDNTLQTSGGGLSVMRIQASGVTFSANTISQTEVGGELVRVSDGASNVTINANTLEITGASGNCECIRVRATESNVSITGNTLKMNGTGRHGIQVDGSTSVGINNNLLLDIGERAINLEGPIGCTVTGNNIDGTGAHGIFVGSGTRILIDGNTIVSNFESISDGSSIATVGTNIT